MMVQLMNNSLAEEQKVAIRAVRSAARVCQAVRDRLVTADTLEKRDRSPVTVADFASQAVVGAVLLQEFPDDPLIGEEDATELRQDPQAAIRAAVVEQVAAGLGQNVSQDQVLDWIDRGGAGDQASPSRFWTLDPIDGTKGFLRGQQYAVALALIEDGQVVLGVLGCPNLQAEGQSGTLLVAVRGQGTRAWPLGTTDADPGQLVGVSSVTDPSQARFCESVESAHSSHGDAQQIASRLGIATEPLRMDSQAKYAAVARGDASIYLRLPTRADYREKIWDHAAGAIVVTEAGGCVTDVTGRPLEFTHGRTLDVNRGVIATNGSIHQAVVGVVGQVIGG